MNTTTSSTIQVTIPAMPPSKFERERRTFFRLLPQLLATHDGQFVAIHEEQVVDAGPDRLAVAMRVLQRIGNVDIFVGYVGDQPEMVARSGIRRALPQSVQDS